MADPQTKPKNLRTWILAVLAMVAGAAGTSEAGFTPDVELLKALGIVGALLLIGYLEYRLMPVAHRIAAGLDRAFPVGAAAPVAELDTVVVEPPIRRETKPRIAVVRRPTESGFVRPALLVWMFATSFLMVGACSWLRSETKRTASTVIDCTAARATAAIKEFGPTLEHVIVGTIDAAGHADWNTISDVTQDFAADVGACVMESVIARLVALDGAGGVQSSPLDIDRGDLAARWDELRASRYTGLTFKSAP